MQVKDVEDQYQFVGHIHALLEQLNLNVSSHGELDEHDEPHLILMT